MRYRYRDIKPYGLRLQPSLKDKLDAIVIEKQKTDRSWSLNSEIETRLEESLMEKRALASYTDGELIDELIRRFGRDAFVIQVVKKET